jgi:putative addiction module killer protein
VAAEARRPPSEAKILVTVQRMAQGHFGDAKSVGPGVMETRIHVGPGYRLYYTRRGGTLVILLAGGDKSTQARDMRAPSALPLN